MVELSSSQEEELCYFIEEKKSTCWPVKTFSPVAEEVQAGLLENERALISKFTQ